MTSNPDIDPNSIVARIISELENQPGVRPLLLRTLLTDEFLAMPARLMRMDDDISVLKNDVAELKTDMNSVKNDLGYLKGRGPRARPGKIGPRSSDQPTGLARYAHHKGTYGRSDA